SDDKYYEEEIGTTSECPIMIDRDDEDDKSKKRKEKAMARVGVIQSKKRKMQNQA
ncbi:10160_t:CDS:2, partial [Gigaspora rosea]